MWILQDCHRGLLWFPPLEGGGNHNKPLCDCNRMHHFASFWNFILSLSLPLLVSRGLACTNTLIGDITQGGLNMIHIHSFNVYLKLSWIKRLLTNPEGKWQKLFLTDLNGGERVLYLQKEKLREISVSLKKTFLEWCFTLSQWSKTTYWFNC